MFEILFTRLGIITLIVVGTALFFIGRSVVIAWRDTNGNGQIDPGE